MTRTRRRTASVLAGLALIVAACSSEGVTESEPATSTTDDAGTDEGDAGDVPAEPMARTVQVDGEFDDANVTINGYVPSDLEVRPGDTVGFALHPGDAHTMTFGSLVEIGLAAGPGGPDGPSPESEAIPDALTVNGEPVSTGLAPCYSDDPPDDGSACEQQEQPEFRGDLAFYNSGAIQPGSTFTMEIAEDIEPGEYGYLCLIHGFAMTGTLTVVEPGEEVPTPDEVEEDRERTLEDLAASMDTAVSDLDDGVLASFSLANDIFTDGDDATVIAGGFGGPRSYFIGILQFGPDEVEIEAGQTVRWHFQTGGHTISFNPTPDATPYIVTGDDGLPTVNELALAAQGGAAAIPAYSELIPDPEPGPPPPATVIDGGEWDGQGFFSSGLAPQFAPVSYDITFTEPGTYDYQCLVHAGMTGSVTVTS